MSLGGIKCPDGFGGIQFKSAHYGRQDVETCPHTESSDLNCGYSVLEKFQGPWEGQDEAFNITEKKDGTLKLNNKGVFWINVTTPLLGPFPFQPTHASELTSTPLSRTTADRTFHWPGTAPCQLKLMLVTWNKRIFTTSTDAGSFWTEAKKTWLRRKRSVRGETWFWHSLLIFMNMKLWRAYSLCQVMSSMLEVYEINRPVTRAALNYNKKEWKLLASELLSWNNCCCLNVSCVPFQKTTDCYFG